MGGKRLIGLADEHKDTSFIYGLYDANGSLRYIGKANNIKKRLSSHMRDCHYRSTPVCNWLKKNGKPTIVVIEECIKSEWEDRERFWIQKARDEGEKLLNVADGGCAPFSGATSAQRSNTAKKAVNSRDQFSWRFNRDFGQGYKDGLLLPRTKEILRELAVLNPKKFGRWKDCY